MSILGIDINLIRGGLMIFLIVAFLGMWAWAWSRKRTAVFQDASQLPLEEDRAVSPEPAVRQTHLGE